MKAIGDRPESAIATLLPKLPRYRQYRVALAAFESTRKEAEERELRRRSEFWLTLPGHAFERELAAVLEWSSPRAVYAGIVEAMTPKARREEQLASGGR